MGFETAPYENRCVAYLVRGVSVELVLELWQLCS